MYAAREVVECWSLLLKSSSTCSSSTTSAPTSSVEVVATTSRPIGIIGVRGWLTTAAEGSSEGLSLASSGLGRETLDFVSCFEGRANGFEFRGVEERILGGTGSTGAFERVASDEVLALL